ncbi:MAG: gfo/Idh/MocA family oxidoreductase [Nitrospiraceae bacterium]|nr:MAG: gfo/Idh/MocA family oxidoreductase [Nitrospiraceae bacterium]
MLKNKIDDGINIGIIGCNYWGRILLRNLVENAGCCSKFRISACSDYYSSNLKFIEERYPFISIIKEPAELIRSPKIDAIVIASDVSTHYSLARRAILNKKHLLVDKLIASTSIEAEEIVDLSHSQGTILMVTNPLEYSPAGIKIKELLERKNLGKVYYITSSRMNFGIYRHDINVIWDLAYHDISLQNWWLKELPENVWATGKNSTYKGMCDTAFINMEFPSGIMTNIGVSWLSPKKLRRMVICGSKKMLVFDDARSSEKIQVYDKGAELKDPESFDEFQLTYRSGDVLSPRIDTYEPLTKTIEHFFECIEKNNDPRTNGKNGIQVIKILEAIDRSLINNGHVEKVV